MAMTFLAAKQDVARNVGGSTVSGELTIAGLAITNAIRDIDSRHDFDFRLKTLTDITVVANTATYALTASDTAVKKIHSARLKTNKRTLGYMRQREVDRVLRDQEQTEIPAAYIEVLSETGVSIKLIPTPSLADILQVRVYETIKDTYGDSDNLAVPLRYLPAVLTLARYYFLIDRDAEDPRAQVFLQKAEALIQAAIVDDAGSPDEDIRLIPSDEWGGAYGTDIITDVMDFGW